MPGKIKRLLCLRHFRISSLKVHTIRMQIMAANYPRRKISHPTSRYGRAMDRSQPSSQVSTTLSGVPMMFFKFYGRFKQIPPKTLFKEIPFTATVHIFFLCQLV